jgi:hypothetical protein
MNRYYDAGDIDLDEEVVLDSKGNRIDEVRASEMAEHTLRTAGRPSGVVEPMPNEATQSGQATG